MKSNFDDYMIKVSKQQKKNPMLRKGQILFNEFYKIYPHEAGLITATELDPFYDDEIIDVFLVYIKKIFKEND
jgi:hypothetical protein